MSSYELIPLESYAISWSFLNSRDQRKKALTTDERKKHSLEDNAFDLTQAFLTSPHLLTAT